MISIETFSTRPLHKTETKKKRTIENRQPLCHINTVSMICLTVLTSKGLSKIAETPSC